MVDKCGVGGTSGPGILRGGKRCSAVEQRVPIREEISRPSLKKLSLQPPCAHSMQAALSFYNQPNPMSKNCFFHQALTISVLDRALYFVTTQQKLDDSALPCRNVQNNVKNGNTTLSARSRSSAQYLSANVRKVDQRRGCATFLQDRSIQAMGPWRRKRMDQRALHSRFCVRPGKRSRYDHTIGKTRASSLPYPT